MCPSDTLKHPAPASNDDPKAKKPKMPDLSARTFVSSKGTKHTFRCNESMIVYAKQMVDWFNATVPTLNFKEDTSVELTRIHGGRRTLNHKTTHETNVNSIAMLTSYIFGVGPKPFISAHSYKTLISMKDSVDCVWKHRGEQAVQMAEALKKECSIVKLHIVTKQCVYNSYRNNTIKKCSAVWSQPWADALLEETMRTGDEQTLTQAQIATKENRLLTASHGVFYPRLLAFDWLYNRVTEEGDGADAYHRVSCVKRITDEEKAYLEKNVDRHQFWRTAIEDDWKKVEKEIRNLSSWESIQRKLEANALADALEKQNQAAEAAPPAAAQVAHPTVGDTSNEEKKSEDDDEVDSDDGDDQT